MRRNKRVTFQVGDKVVYPSQGAGVVVEKTTREVLGETREYLKVDFVRGDMSVLVPLEKGQDVGLRHTVGDDELEQLSDAIRKGDLSLPNQWPPRHRAELDILAANDAYDLARLIGALFQRDQERGLADTERDIFENAKSLLSSEWAVVAELDYGAAQQTIGGILEQTLS